MSYWIWTNLGTISIFESYTEEGVIIVDVRDLDDAEQDKEKVRKKIEVVAGLLCAGFRVVVRCIGGINRSNSIALATMCYIEPHGDLEETWDFHYNTVKQHCHRAHLCPELTDTIKKVLKDGRKTW